MTSSPLPMLLSVQAARVDRDGCPLCEGLTLQAHGERVVLVGPGAEAIGAAIAHEAVVAEGRILVDGYDVGNGQHVGRVGVAPLDPPLPPGMTVQGYIALSLQTAGFGAKTAEMAAVSNLADLGLSALGTRRTEALTIPERRALVLVAAMLPGARALVAQTPLAGLEGPECHYLFAVLGQLSRRRNVLATSMRFDPASPERDLIMGATRVAWVDRSEVLWSGTAGMLVQAGPLMTLSVRGEHIEAFLASLTEQGFKVHGAPPRFTLSLPTLNATADLLAVAEATDTAVVEMAPLVQASLPKEPETPPSASQAPEPEELSTRTQATSDQEQSP